MATREFNEAYAGEYLNRVAFPLGGIGAGMVCLEGTGALSHFSLRHKPDLFNEPLVFSALSIRGPHPSARVLEGPVPRWKAYGYPGAANGMGGRTYGLPRFAEAQFLARFPFAHIALKDPSVPLECRITAWSPFVPGDADASSMPVAALEYAFRNSSGQVVDALYTFNAANFLAADRGEKGAKASDGGFMLWQSGMQDAPQLQACFTASLLDDRALVNLRWFRGGWFDPLTMLWRQLASGHLQPEPEYTEGSPSPGASLGVPFTLQPGEEKRVRLLLSWYVPVSEERQGKDEAPSGCGCGCACAPKETYRPWYAERFKDGCELAGYWRDNCSRLREESKAFSDCLFDTTLPPEVVEAVAANLSILKSPTVLRQADGRLWCWEGCHDNQGCCAGSCTHVWNYAQALPHLFPSLERTLRETEFGVSQDERGHQNFRSSLPIRQPGHDFHAAADGQLGGVMKVFREWRISGATGWLRSLWPQVKKSLDYCISTWDPDHTGLVREPHHNTYDIEFWGPDGLCSSFYLGALKAATIMAEALREDAAEYATLLQRGRAAMEQELFNGEFFFQKVQWEELRADAPYDDPGYSPEAREILRKEGPKYQYGAGCLSDGILGAWIGAMCGLTDLVAPDKVKSTLQSIFRYNFQEDLSQHANTQRPTYAFGTEGGLIACTWPKGDRPALPFPYADEVWTGMEYQVASHLMMCGCVDEGLAIVRAARRRYDGRWRDPFDEYECGHYYARAMSSYGLIQGLTGARYDAVEKTLYLSPSIKGDFRAFLAVDGGYGTAGMKDGKPFLEVKRGRIEVSRIIC